MEYRLVSADSHLSVPPGFFRDYLPAQYRDHQWVRAIESMQKNALKQAGMGLAHMAGRRVEDYQEKDISEDDVRPGAYEPVARLADMDLDGVWGQLTFPNFARFAGHRFYRNVRDLDAGLVCLRAYNDYLLDEWCATDPERLYGVAILPLCDIDLAVAEADRVLAKGARAIAFSENPTVLGLPSIHTCHWDPLWAIVSDAHVPICMHIGSSSRLVTTSDDAPPTVLVTLNGVNSMLAGADWLMAGVLERFPGLRLVLSEGGAGWIPYLLERAEKAFADARLNRDLSIGQAGKGSRPPRALFADHMYVCLVDEHFALRSLGEIPVDNLVWEGDYPHGDGRWPDNRGYLEQALADVPDTDAVKIAETNLRSLLGV